MNHTIIFTIGYGNMEYNKLHDILIKAGVDLLIDVRSHPEWSHDKEYKDLNTYTILEGERVILNRWFGNDNAGLGAQPGKIALYNDKGVAEYKNIASTPQFKKSIEIIYKAAKKGYVVCLMCSEEDPIRCHRAILCSHMLKYWHNDVEVKHIRHDQNGRVYLETNKEFELRLMKTNGTGDINEAYRRQAAKIQHANKIYIRYVPKEDVMKVTIEPINKNIEKENNKETFFSSNILPEAVMDPLVIKNVNPYLNNEKIWGKYFNQAKYDVETGNATIDLKIYHYESLQELNNKYHGVPTEIIHVLEPKAPKADTVPMAWVEDDIINVVSVIEPDEQKCYHLTAQILNDMVEAGILKRHADEDKGSTFSIGLNISKSERLELNLLKVTAARVDTFIRRCREIKVLPNGIKVVLNKKAIQKLEGGVFSLLSTNLPASKRMGKVQYTYSPEMKKYVKEIAGSMMGKIDAALRKQTEELKEEMEYDPAAKDARKQYYKMDRMLKNVPNRERALEIILNLLSEEELILIANCNGADSRYRGVIGDSKKVFCWQTCKLLRAFLQTPEEDLTERGVESLALFVYDLTKKKRLNSRKEMIAWGKAVLDGTKKDYEQPGERFEQYWLERILNRYSKFGTKGWNIPIECDQTAEVLATMGAVFGIKSLMWLTNVVSLDGDTVNDAWTLLDKEGNKLIDRTLIKKVITMIAYGASADPKAIVEHCKHVVKLGYVKSFTQHDVEIIKSTIAPGGRFECVKFIGHFFRLMKEDPRTHWTLNMGENLTFELDAQKGTRFYNQTTKEAEVEELKLNVASIGLEYDNDKDLIGHITLTETKRSIGKTIVDGSSMRRYFITCLIHCLGARLSQMVMTEILCNGGWILNNHDAHIVHPNWGHVVSETLQKGYREIVCKGEDILTEYLKSLNIVTANGHTLNYKDLCEAFKGAQAVNRGDKEGAVTYKCGEFCRNIKPKDGQKAKYAGLDAITHGFNINA